jgi:V/A-type H+-transporting ATPase subunit I
MKKVCLAVQEKDNFIALSRLREAGVMHIIRTGIVSEQITKALERKTRVEEAFSLIQPYKTPKKKEVSPKGGGRERRAPLAPGQRRGRRAVDKMGDEDLEPYSLDAVNAPVRPTLVDYMMGIRDERKIMEDRETALKREHERIANWGDFSADSVKELAALGLPVFLYEIDPTSFAKISKEIQYIKFHEDKTVVRLLVPYREIPGLAQFQIPEKPLSKINDELEVLKNNLTDIDNRIRTLADRRPALVKEMVDVQSNIDFELAKVEFQSVEGIQSEYGISLLKGYIPVDKIENLKVTAANNNWALTIYEPAPEDIPPTLLKNGPVASFMQPLLSFLGTVPGYKEFDISPSYLFFFSLFFSMIFGDAAYGLIIISVSLMIGISYVKKSGKLPQIIKLFLLLGSCTVAWGAINGSWFAIPVERLPGFLTALILPPFNNTGPLVEFPAFLQNIFNLPEKVPTGELKTRWNIQFLCFSVALIQLVWARGKRIINLLPKLSAIAQFGWMMMMVGLYFLVLLLLLKVQLPEFVIPFVVTGLVLNIIFGEQNGGNFFANIGKGFGGLFQLILKVIGGFGDIISYVRLFAVGFAGSMIAEIFNTMALGGGLGEFGVGFILKLIVAVLILAIGHALNLALTSLSVLVHGVRLNLLEYAGNHLEMEWSGYTYNPFALRQKKE